MRMCEISDIFYMLLFLDIIIVIITAINDYELKQIKLPAKCGMALVYNN